MSNGLLKGVNARALPVHQRLVDAKLAWENQTTPRECKCGKLKRPPTFIFRQFGDALANLEWGGECVIKHIETLNERKGSATALVEFLKRLADEHCFVLSGTATVYTPCCGTLKERLTQDQLEAWYQKCGFDVHHLTPDAATVRYPKR